MKHIKKLQIAAVSVLLFAAVLFLIPMPKASAAEITSAAGQVTLASGSLNVRSTADLSGTVISWLPAGSYVTLLSKSGNWWRVEYAPGSYGYASATYIRYVYGTYAVAATSSSGNVSVYSGPGTSYGVTGSIPSGRTILVLSDNAGWSFVLYNGSKTGYIPAQNTRSLMAWPVPASHKINQYFGTHQGIDIGAAVRGVTGDTIIAAQGGKVVYAGWLNGYGYVVYVNSVYNGQPIQTRYGHLVSAPVVSAGQNVGIGQVIGYMGSTGTSSGVHLHFEVRVRSSFADCISNADSTPVDPIGYVS